MKASIGPAFRNGGEGLARSGIVPAIKPQFPTRRQKVDKFTGGEVLGPRRPIDRPQALRNRCVVNLESIQVA